MSGPARAKFKPVHTARSWLRSVAPAKDTVRADLLAGWPGAISSVPDRVADIVVVGVSPTHDLYASTLGPNRRFAGEQPPYGDHPCHDTGCTPPKDLAGREGHGEQRDGGPQVAPALACAFNPSQERSQQPPSPTRCVEARTQATVRCITTTWTRNPLPYKRFRDWTNDDARLQSRTQKHDLDGQEPAWHASGPPWALNRAAVVETMSGKRAKKSTGGKGARRRPSPFLSTASPFP
jgi:hypothetical protein